jgi:hypothetical protein
MVLRVTCLACRSSFSPGQFCRETGDVKQTGVVVTAVCLFDAIDTLDLVGAVEVTAATGHPSRMAKGSCSD